MIVVSRWFTAALFAACFLIAGSGLAGQGTQEGGGTWGSVLQISVQADGPTASFTVSRKDGRPFSMESAVSVRSGSWSGPELASATVGSGSRSAVLTADMDRIAQGDQSFYAYLANSYGHAWAGPAHLSGHDGSYHPLYQPPVSPPEEYEYTGPQHHGDRRQPPPSIDSWPYEAELCREVFIGVTAQSSACRPGRVRIECKAEDDGRPFSQWLQPGERTELRFQFRSAGTKTICCRTIDDCDRSSRWTKRTIRVKECNRPPVPPVICPKPCDACVNRPVRIAMTPGADPDGDQVQVKCTAQDAYGSPYSSGWYSVPHPSDADFTFYSLGRKRITCTTYDTKGAASSPASRFIDIRRCCDDGRCKEPCRGRGCHARTETKISISVISEAGSGGDRIRVQRDDDRHPGPVSYDEPYVPEYQNWSPNYRADQEQEESVDIPLNPDYGDARIQQDYDGP